MVFFGKEKRKRTRLSKTEWEAIKKRHGNKCLMCGRTERSTGVLEKAHIKAHSKGGTQYFPLCPTCHRKFDGGKATATELRKLGISKEAYARLRPKKPKKKTDAWF
jgi:hypothetical protein